MFFNFCPLRIQRTKKVSSSIICNTFKYPLASKKLQMASSLSSNWLYTISSEQKLEMLTEINNAGSQGIRTLALPKFTFETLMLIPPSKQN